MVPVANTNGFIRLCGEFKLTVNREAQADSYLLPRIDGLLTSLSNGTSFSKLDLAHVYIQLELHTQSKKLVTINTEKELYHFTHLPFGIAGAPAFIQRTMENNFQEMSKVVVYIDDLLVMGPTEEKHLNSLQEVWS